MDVGIPRVVSRVHGSTRPCFTRFAARHLALTISAVLQSRCLRRRRSFPFTFPLFAMDSDRKSVVSSFYGGRRSSVDALNRDYVVAASSSEPRARRDSSSSFFNPAATGGLPRGAAPPPRMNGAGYNRMSYFDAGREEPVKGGYDEVEQPNEGGWDVFADFNNTGPRYSHAFGLSNKEARCVAFSSIMLTGLAHTSCIVAINNSHHSSRRRWTRRLVLKDLLRWSRCPRWAQSGERTS